MAACQPVSYRAASECDVKGLAAQVGQHKDNEDG